MYAIRLMGKDDTGRAARGRAGKTGRWRAAARWVLVVLCAYIVAPYLLVLLYALVNPPVTALMVLRLFEGNGVRQDWVGLDEIARSLPATVIMTEDGRFCEHAGVDWEEVGKVLETVGGGDEPRGASTIPMQTAKNLFLWPWRSYVRKVLEVPLAYWIDLVWSKRRIIEVYLNTVEWGPGIYGAQAAAQAHFSRSAKQLSWGQSALLAAVLPDPTGRDAGRPGRTTRALAARAQARGRQAGQYIACIR